MRQADVSMPGVDLWRMPVRMDPRYPVYRPEQQTGLMDDADAAAAHQRFAGGLLSGFQVVPDQGDPRTYGMRDQAQRGRLFGGIGPDGAASAASPPQAGTLFGGIGRSAEMQPARHGHPQSVAPLPQLVNDGGATGYPGGRQVMPVNPSGVYSGTPTTRPAETATDSGFGDMTTGDFLRQVVYVDRLGRDPGSLGSDPVHNLLGGEYGLYQMGRSHPQAQRILGVDLDGKLNMEDVKKVTDWISRQSASPGQGDGGGDGGAR